MDGIMGSKQNSKPKRHFFVHAHWDAAVKRIYAESDIIGLNIETDTIEEFREVMEDVAGALIFSNHYTAEQINNTPLSDLIPIIDFEDDRVINKRV